MRNPTIDDRDVVINQNNRRVPTGAGRALVASVVALAGLAALWLLIQTLDPQARAAREAAQWRATQLDSDLYTVDMLAGALLRLALPVALATAALGVVFVLLRLVYIRWASVMAVQAHYNVKAIEAQRQPVPHTLTYSPHYARELALPAVAPAPGALPPALDAVAPALPPITDLASLNYQPTKQAVLLGLAPHGALITAPLSKLWHVATAGPTGNGKSNIHRLLLAQLLAVGAHVAVGDPKWTSYDVEQDEDWRPIERRLHLAPAVDSGQIGALLDYAIGQLQTRMEKRRMQEPVGLPLFICLDELPWIYDHVKGSPEAIAELVRLGRGVHVLVLAAAQDFLVKSTGLGAARDNFRSAFYLGGDLKTGSVLLDLPQRELANREGSLDLGAALLRSSATTPAQLVRVPYVSNESLYRLLGAPAGANPGVVIDTEPVERTTFAPDVAPIPTSTGVEHTKALDPRAHRVRELLREKAGVNEILRAVWNLDSKERGAAYKAALAEYQGIVAGLVE